MVLSFIWKFRFSELFQDEKVLEIEINRLKTENIEMQKQIDGFHADGSKLFAAEAQMVWFISQNYDFEKKHLENFKKIAKINL